MRKFGNEEMRELVNGVRGCVRGMRLCLRNQTKFKQNQGYALQTSGEIVSLFNFGKGRSTTGEYEPHRQS